MSDKQGTDVGYSRNLPAMLCVHNSARIQTALINIQVSKYCRGKTRTVESARKAFYYRKSISRQVRIFDPVIVSKTLQVKWWKTRAIPLQFQTY